MNNRPIGVLDSGVGGLTAWKEITKLLPKESTIYIADSKNVPYGNKTASQIHKLSRKLAQFLLENDVKLIVVACNAITVTCLDKLRKEFPQVPIVGTVPVVKTAGEKTKSGKIGILSTVRTAGSSYQKRLIKKFAQNLGVLNIGTDKLVPLIEKGEDVNPVLAEILEPFKKVDVLALGCTHFPLIKDKIKKILGPKILILDSGPAIARQVRRVLVRNKLLSNGKKATHHFYTTANQKLYNRKAKKVVL